MCALGGGSIITIIISYLPYFAVRAGIIVMLLCIPLRAFPDRVPEKREKKNTKKHKKNQLTNQPSNENLRPTERHGLATLESPRLRRWRPSIVAARQLTVVRVATRSARAPRPTEVLNWTRTSRPAPVSDGPLPPFGDFLLSTDSLTFCFPFLFC